jgi:large subunit ribosomal protein L25
MVRAIGARNRERKDMVNVSEKLVVEVDPRSERGKNACRRLRRAGKVPGNVYGLSKEPFAVAVDPRRIEELLRLESGRNTIFTLSAVGGKERREVMVRELQRDPVTELLLHIDFVRFDPDKRLQVAVPVRLVGTATGVKNEGGVVDFVHREVLVSCLPAQIPEHFDVDISELHIGQSVAVRDIPLVENVEILADSEMILAVVAAPRKEEEPVAVEAAEEVAEQPEAEETGKETKTEEEGEKGS